MEILYVSSVPSPNEFDRIKTMERPGVNVTTYGMNESGYKFHTLIMNGLCKYDDVNITSLVGRSVGRSTHLGGYWKCLKEQVSDKLSYVHIGFINFPGVKHVCIGVSLFARTLAWGWKNRGKQKGIIMDASYVTANPFVLLACSLFKCKTTAIFCDIYEYMADVKDARANEKVSLPRRIIRSIAGACYRRLDSYIFLTEQMNPLINPTGKPYIVMEGLVDSNMEHMPNLLENKTDKKVIMYAGALREAYGVKNLIEGFLACDAKDAELWIFGNGDYKEQVQKYAEKNENIKFGGAIPLKQVIEKELQASLLVNPRPIGMEFTQYSFPSKNMEYMVSGTPILTTRLPGMPKEYYDYIYTIDGDEPEYITEALNKVLYISKEKLHEKGLDARKFVLDKKNNIVQADRIKKLLM